MDKKKKCVVVMSTYNGADYLARQLDTVFSQADVDVTCFVRDDGSKDKTSMILNEYQQKGKRLMVEYGTNVGWEKSFMLALQHAPESDFYAFCDQDDEWLADKLSAGIEEIEKLNTDTPILYHCNKWSVYEDLKPLPHQVRRTPHPLNRENAIIQEYAQGCSIIMNRAARELVLRHLPQRRIAHDFWCGLVCYLFGKVIYDDRKLFYHISHGNNSSGEGHMCQSWLSRFRRIFKSEEVYYNPLDDLLEGYSDLLSDKDILFLNRLKNYKSSLKDKFYLLTSPRFIRDSFFGTISLKLCILLNRI
jgi:rhamnosyltransferase